MQREFTFVLVALLMVSSLAITFVIHQTIQGALTQEGFRFGRISPYEVLSDVTYTLIVRVSVVLFITLIVIGVFGVFFLHRVAGPVYRFRQVFLRINRGEIPSEIRLRAGDFFEETAVEINQLIKRLEFEKEKAKLAKEKADEILAASPPDNVTKPTKELKTILDRQPSEG
jgi:signal transduction histidine kinase